MRLCGGRMARRRRCLALFQLLLLRSMLFLDLLRLLSVALLHLLFLRVVVVFLGGLLVIFFLLLLEFLVILCLLGSKLVLLLLIFLVGCRVAGVWRRELVWLQIARVTVRAGTSFGGSFRTIFRVGARFIPRTRFIAPCGIGWRSLVFSAGLFGGHNPSLEITGSGSGRDGRLALVG